MIEAGYILLTILPQTEERIDFSLHSGTILVAIAFFVLVNVLLAAALYPYLRGGSSPEASTEEISGQEEGKNVVEEASDDEPLEEKVDEFLEDIQGGERR